MHNNGTVLGLIINMITQMSMPARRVCRACLSPRRRPNAVGRWRPRRGCPARAHAFSHRRIGRRSRRRRATPSRRRRDACSLSPRSFVASAPAVHQRVVTASIEMLVPGAHPQQPDAGAMAVQQRRHAFRGKSAVRVVVPRVLLPRA